MSSIKYFLLQKHISAIIAQLPPLRLCMIYTSRLSVSDQALLRALHKIKQGDLVALGQVAKKTQICHQVYNRLTDLCPLAEVIQ